MIADDGKNQKNSAAGRHVLVVGSANIDVSVTTAHFPSPGETVPADAAVISVGGKGANQAVASAAGGAATEFVARIGDDAFGRMVRDDLAARGVGLHELKAVPGETTGLAAIYVDRTGQNCIVVARGANGMLSPADIDVAESLIRSAAVIVLQCESPLETIRRTIELAARHTVPVIFNPAPSEGIDLARMPRGITYLVPNESEASQLSGQSVGSVADAKRCAVQLQSGGIDCVIITLGSEGCVAADAGGARHLPAHRVSAVDTTGAGDAFIGCLAASLAGGHTRDDAIRRALVYASLSTTRRGAQVSYPRREEFEQLLLELSKDARDSLDRR
jgi:ribokinase